MEYGISGAPLDSSLRYGSVIEAAAQEADTPPKLAYAIAYVESISGELAGFWDAATVKAGDGGCGLFQLTPPPPNIVWTDPCQNASAACLYWMNPALDFWHAAGYTGDTLVRLVADEYNEGRSAAWRWHLAGDADLGTTGSNYGARVLAVYTALVAGAATLPG
jgi:hypothetical protein